jgi:hypothetical protein
LQAPATKCEEVKEEQKAIVQVKTDEQETQKTEPVHASKTSTALSVTDVNQVKDAKLESKPRSQVSFGGPLSKA